MKISQIAPCVSTLAESFHLNGHIIGFRPQTKKLESPYKTPSSTLAVKGLTEISKLINFEGNSFKLSEGIPPQSRAVNRRLKNFENLQSHIFVSFQQITLNLGFITSSLRSFL